MQRKPGFIVFGGLVLLAAGLIVIGIFRFARFRGGGLDGLQARPQPSVFIVSPQTGSQASVKAPLSVAVTAHSYELIASLELWVNGARMGRQDSLPENATALDATFLWNPGAPGIYSLVARLTDRNGDSADSPAILVDVAAYTPPAGGV